jgi:hypothetical protein
MVSRNSDSNMLPERFAAVAQVLGSSRKEHPEPTNGTNATPEPTSQQELPENDTSGVIPRTAPEHASLRVSCPSLSLEHEQLPCSQSRAQAEEHAASLLARPLDILVSTSKLETFLVGEESSGAPECLLQNVYESFAILVQSRIRAYATLIARHSIMLGEKQGNMTILADRVEEKIDRLFQVAGAVYAEEMITRFELEEDDSDVDVVSTDEGTNQSAGTPLTLRILLDLVLPVPSGEDIVFKITFDAPGTIKGMFC